MANWFGGLAGKAEKALRTRQSEIDRKVRQMSKGEKPKKKKKKGK